MNNLSQFAKKTTDVNLVEKEKTVSCLVSCDTSNTDKITLVLSMKDYAKAKATSSGKEIYLNFTQSKINVEIDGQIVGLRVAGNVFIGQAK